VSTPAIVQTLKHAVSGGVGRIATLAQQGVSTDLQRNLALAFIFVAVAGGVYQSIDDPRGMIRRLSAGYVARLDAQQRWMFMPESGARIAWTQLVVVLGVLLVYGFEPIEWLPALAALVVVVPPVLVGQQVSKRRARIDEQAHGFALALGSALKATASIGDAL
jgi:hypothetical protein